MSFSDLANQPPVYAFLSEVDTVLSGGEAMHAISLFGSLYRGGQSGRKKDTKIFNLHSLGRYLHVLNLPTFVYTCWLVCKLTIH